MVLALRLNVQGGDPCRGPDKTINLFMRGGK